MITNKTKKKRFGKMLDYFRRLEKREPAAFSLVHWIQADYVDDLLDAMRTWRDRLKAEIPLNCGTSACVVGHMPNIFPTHFKWTGYGSNGCSVEEDTPSAWVRYKQPYAAAYGTEEFFEPEAGWMMDHLGGTYDQWVNIIMVKYYRDEGLTYDTKIHGMRDQDVELKHVIKRMEALYEELYGNV